VKTIIGIDPGKSGGVAYQIPHGLPAAESMPETTADLIETLRNIDAPESIVCYVERVPSFAGRNMPGHAMFKMGESFGAIQGALAGLKIRTVLVTPQQWQKHYSLGTRSACKSDGEWKRKLKAEAQRRFPTLKLTNATADAALILDYAMTKEKQ
jgi:hypothetical protein